MKMKNLARPCVTICELPVHPAWQRRCASILLFLALTGAALAQDGQQQFAKLGDFKLQKGEVIRDCVVGYRTFGQLNADKSNVVLFPTWFSGTSGQLAEMIGPGRMVDSSRYYVIAVDALGNGVSSSPSNSQAQPHMKFPRFTIEDMVRSQRQLLTEVLHLNHIRAVMGGSMGGMQTFQWMVSFPDFMDKAIPIVGSPRLAPYDLLLWQTENDAIMNDPAWKNGDYVESPARVAIGEITGLTLTTPEQFDKENSREQVLQSRWQSGAGPAFDANNHIRQSQAMMDLDVSVPFGGSMERAAAAVKAKVLVIVCATDHTVTPGPALAFAKLLHAEVLELEGPCGHLEPGCEAAKVNPAIARFLEN